MEKRYAWFVLSQDGTEHSHNLYEKLTYLITTWRSMGPDGMGQVSYQISFGKGNLFEVKKILTGESGKYYGVVLSGELVGNNYYDWPGEPRKKRFWEALIKRFGRKVIKSP
jgi:hypothetical protein